MQRLYRLSSSNCADHFQFVKEHMGRIFTREQNVRQINHQFSFHLQTSTPLLAVLQNGFLSSFH